VGELRLSSERQARKTWLDRKRSKDSAAQMAGGQAKMIKNPGQDPGFLDGSDDFQFASTVRAVFDVDIEDPIRKPFLCFRPSGRHVPFKTRSRRFCQAVTSR